MVPVITVLRRWRSSVMATWVISTKGSTFTTIILPWLLWPWRSIFTWPTSVLNISNNMYWYLNRRTNRWIGCSISQNSASVILRGFLKFVSKICQRYLNYAWIKSICPSVIFRGCLNYTSVILIYARNYRGSLPLCYTLRGYIWDQNKGYPKTDTNTDLCVFPTPNYNDFFRVY